jgi:hypothetical protein
MSTTDATGPLCHKCQKPCTGSYIHLDGASFHSNCVFDANLMAEKERLASRLFNLERQMDHSRRLERLSVIRRLDCIGPPCDEGDPCPVCAAQEYQPKSE